MSKRPVVFVSDDARGVRTSELRELYALGGDMRTVADALGVSVSTVCRSLGGQKASSADRAQRLAAVREALDRPTGELS